RSSLLGAALADQRVAKRAEQIAELVLAADQSGPRENARVGLLDEILRLLARPRPRTRSSVETRKVLYRTFGIEPARHGSNDGASRPCAARFHGSTGKECALHGVGHR